MVTGKKDVHIISGFPDSFFLTLQVTKRQEKKREKNNYDNVNNSEKKAKTNLPGFSPIPSVENKKCKLVSSDVKGFSIELIQLGFSCTSGIVSLSNH